MEPTLAEIRIFAGNFAPRGWALCEGQLLAINANSALFSLLGTIYGGDGRTTFGLPDMRGRAALHAGHGPGLSQRNEGAKGGSEVNTITQAQLANHTHIAVIKAASSATSNDPNGRVPAKMSGRTTSNPPKDAQVTGYTNTTGAVMADNMLKLGDTGNSQPVDNMQPFLAINFIIALQGIFPSRS